MPTVLRFDGLRAVIYPNDHRPAHVHVIGGGCEAVFELRCPAGPPTVRENYGFGKAQIAQIKAKVASDLKALCAEWSRIHGQP